nr:hypothetical protein L204_03454 [Cryptococcus depauperatus CBS 7855]
MRDGWKNAVKSGRIDRSLDLIYPIADTQTLMVLIARRLLRATRGDMSQNTHCTCRGNYQSCLAATKDQPKSVLAIHPTLRTPKSRFPPARSTRPISQFCDAKRDHLHKDDVSLWLVQLWIPH